MLRRPPRLAERWLRRCLPAAIEDDVALDLEELHLRRARRDGQLRADGWYWRQALVLPWRLRFDDLTAAHSAIPRGSFMQTTLIDLRHAARLFKTQRAMTVAIVASLAVGIGLTAAVFSVVDVVLLRPAPVADIDGLAVAWETDRTSGTTREPASVPDFLDYRQQTRGFERLGGLIAREVNFAPSSGDPIRLAALAVSHDLLPLLGVKPIAGESLRAEDDEPGAPVRALISHGLWTRVFGRHMSIVGQTIQIDDRPVTVAGVMPEGADFGVLQMLRAAAYSRSFADRGEAVRVDVWLPLQPNAATSPRSTHPLFMLGRLAPDTSIQLAREEMTRLAADLERRYPDDNTGRGVFVEPLGAIVLGPSRPALLALQGAAALVLLVAVVNVANLLMARGTTRRREMAVRGALGASGRQLVRLLLTESLALAAAGGTLGVVFAVGLVAWCRAAGPASIPRLAEASVDLRVIGVTAFIAVASALAFGLFPAVLAMRASPSEALTAAPDRGATDSRGRGRLRSALVIGEVALAVTLVSSAGLLIKSFWLLQQVDPGFSAAGVTKAEFQLPVSRYPMDFSRWPRLTEIHGFHARLLEQARTLPGASGVAVAGEHPLAPGFTNSFSIVGRPNESHPEITVRRVTPEYFDVVGLPLRSGRLLSSSDTTDAAAVALVNEVAAARLFPAGNAIGQSISMWGAARRIVGIVANEHFRGLDAGAVPGLYLPTSQAPSGVGVLLVRHSSGTAPRPASELRSVFREIDPALAVFGIEPLTNTVSRSVAERAFTMALLTGFAGVALVLAAIGIHGVQHYRVAQRRREIAIRLALGADPGRLRRRVVTQGLVLTGSGLVFGAAGSLVLGRVLESLLYSVSPADPAVLAGVTVLLAGVATIASYLPARKASCSAERL